MAGGPQAAWRHLSSIIERHPEEGTAYQQVAEELEHQGRVEDIASGLVTERAASLEEPDAAKTPDS